MASLPTAALEDYEHSHWSKWWADSVSENLHCTLKKITALGLYDMPVPTLELMGVGTWDKGPMKQEAFVRTPLILFGIETFFWRSAME